MKENDVKRALIEKLVRDSSVRAIAQEYVFDFGRCRADVVCLKNERLIGYEIKSAFDKITRLPDQLESYCRFFDYTYVVCDEKHLPSVEVLAKKDVGLYLCASRKVKRIRTARITRGLDSIIGLDTLPVSALRNVFGLSARSKYEVCELIVKTYSSKDIRKKIIENFAGKYEAPTNIFRGEIAGLVTLDDLRLLDLCVDEIA
ncbi:sce7726 family protein [Pseudomonas aeruginosa]|uniref:sce7726 family protein n=1 Tax=Pseudomonas aeruginosa TaxID=287 RepID=UPI0008FAF943|nr:sce7726 family protein [Pseudomonas aeruginosa]